ncbi:MAG: hypothetical protein U1E31_00435 [Rickettsiales bacterium]
MNDIKLQSDFINGKGEIDFKDNKYIKFNLEYCDLEKILSNLNNDYLKFILIDGANIEINTKKLKYNNIILNDAKLTGKVINNSIAINIDSYLFEDNFLFNINGLIYYDSNNYWCANLIATAKNNFKIIENINDNQIIANINNNQIEKENLIFNTFTNKNINLNFYSNIHYDQFGLSLINLKLNLDKAILTGFVGYRMIGDTSILETNIIASNFNFNKEKYPQLINFFEKLNDKKFLKNTIKDIKITRDVFNHKIELKNTKYKDISIDQIKINVNSYDDYLTIDEFSFKNNDDVFDANILLIPNNQTPKLFININKGIINSNKALIFDIFKNIAIFNTSIQANLSKLTIDNIVLNNINLVTKTDKNQLLIKELNFMNNFTKSNILGYILLDPININLKYNINNFDAPNFFNLDSIINGNLNLEGKITSYGNTIDEIIYNAKSSIKFSSDIINIKKFNIDNLISNIRYYQKNNTKIDKINLKSSLYINDGNLNNISGFIDLNKGIFNGYNIIATTSQSGNKISFYYDLYNKNINWEILSNFYSNEDLNKIFNFKISNQIRNNKGLIRIEYLDNFQNLFNLE